MAGQGVLSPPLRFPIGCWEFYQFSCLMQIMISSAVFLSLNLNFYQLYLFKTLIRPLPLTI